mmetsp:Transcript_37535/g.105466  ORF Transcript_37535/g.105466 Transcript_37535/m.105466 type:complete len:219 (+) Transcript_37535:274-930(+)
MWEVVIHGAQGALHILEASVHGDAGTVHTMVHLRVHSLQLLDRRVDLLVTLPQRRQILEGRRDDPAHVPQPGPVPGQPQREREVGVPEDRCVREGIYQLQAGEPADHSGAHPLRQHARGGRVVELVPRLGLGNDILQGPGAVEVADDVPKVLVREGPEQLLLVERELPPELEGGDAVKRRSASELALPRLVAVLRQEFRGRLPLVKPVWGVVGLPDGI